LPATLEHKPAKVSKVAGSRHDDSCDQIIRTLRSFVYQPKPNLYIAECVDLNLLSQGRSPEEAFEALNEAVNLYLGTALDGDTAGLLHRPSPWTHRVRYLLHELENLLKGRHEKYQLFPRQRSDRPRLSRC
jgi:hypothetical protein